jgi:hypothetical protein
MAWSGTSGGPDCPVAAASAIEVPGKEPEKSLLGSL